MATIQNPRDTLLQAASVRIVRPNIDLGQIPAFGNYPDGTNQNGVAGPGGTYLKPGYMMNGAVGRLNVGVAAIDTLQIGGNAVTVPFSVSAADALIIPTGGGIVFALQSNIGNDGGTVRHIWASVQLALRVNTADSALDGSSRRLLVTLSINSVDIVSGSWGVSGRAAGPTEYGCVMIGAATSMTGGATVRVQWAPGMTVEQRERTFAQVEARTMTVMGVKR